MSSNCKKMSLVTKMNEIYAMPVVLTKLNGGGIFSLHRQNKYRIL